MNFRYQMSQTQTGLSQRVEFKQQRLNSGLMLVPFCWGLGGVPFLIPPLKSGLNMQRVVSLQSV